MQVAIKCYKMFKKITAYSFFFKVIFSHFLFQCLTRNRYFFFIILFLYIFFRERAKVLKFCGDINVVNRISVANFDAEHVAAACNRERWGR